jgi:hypothetical protein
MQEHSRATPQHPRMRSSTPTRDSRVAFLVSVLQLKIAAFLVSVLQLKTTAMHKKSDLPLKVSGCSKFSQLPHL